MRHRLDRFAALVLTCAFAIGSAGVAVADFTESEDRPFLDPDDSEDDPLAAAMPVPFDLAPFASTYPGGAKLVRGTLDRGDIDAYSISIGSGQLVLGALFEDAGGELNDTTLGLFTGGTAPPIASDDDGGSGFFSRFAFEATSSGTHQIGVSGFGDDLFDGSHQEARTGLVAYRLVVAVTSDPPPLGESEDNDSIGTATALPVEGGVLAGTLDLRDVDYYAIDLEIGDRVAVSLFDLESGSLVPANGERNDSLIGLFGPDELPVAGGVDDDGGPGRMSNRLFTATADGEWRIAVSGFGDVGFVGDHAEEAFDYLLVVARERACPDVTPLISNISASTANSYTVANLKGGDHYYTDRFGVGAHVLVDVPTDYLCSEWIKTPNNDKNETDPNHLSFSLAEDASVFIGYDTRATGEPAWLSSGFTPLGEVLDIRDTDPQQEFDLLRRDFPAGTVVLGGNAAPGAGSNYVVFARPLPTQDPSQALAIPPNAGLVILTVSGVEVQAARLPGQSDAQFAAALADAVNGDPTLSSARIYALASGASFVTTGTIQSVSIVVSVPLFSIWAHLVLFALWFVVATWILTRRAHPVR